MSKGDTMNNFNQFQPQRQQYSSYFNPATGATASTNNIFWVNGIEGAKAWQKHIELAAIDFNIEDNRFVCDAVLNLNIKEQK